MPPPDERRLVNLTRWQMRAIDAKVAGLRHGYLQLVYAKGRLGRVERLDVTLAEDLEREFGGQGAVA